MDFYSDTKWVSWVDQLSEENFVVIDDFVPEVLYNRLQVFFTDKYQGDEFDRAGIGSIFNNQLITAIRGDYTYWIDKERDTEIAPFFFLIEEMIGRLNRYCYLSLSGYEFHFSHYPKGTFYKRHLDQFKGRNNRMISVIIYFNDNWQQGNGGELKLFRQDESELLIAPRAKRCVLLRSDRVEHEVMETHVSRFSLTGWLLYQPSSLGYLLT